MSLSAKSLGLSLLALLCSIAFVLVLFAAAMVGQRHCQTTKPSHSTSTDLRVNGAC